MYKGVFDIFKHWYHDNKGTVLFYSDPHFDDADMSYRNITSDEQVKRMNRNIGKYDTIVFLGDIGNPEYIKKLRGYKVLIMGNHDKGASIYEDYFDEIYEGPLLISDKVILSHEPVNYPFAYNIHGHCHGFEYYDKDDMHLNVCAEHINYTPVRYNRLIELGALKNVPSIHRITIDEATRRKKSR